MLLNIWEMAPEKVAKAKQQLADCKIEMRVLCEATFALIRGTVCNCCLTMQGIQPLQNTSCSTLICASCMLFSEVWVGRRCVAAVTCMLIRGDTSHTQHSFLHGLCLMQQSLMM